MSKQIVINLPVVTLSKSHDFFIALGYSHNTQFTDDTAVCVAISEVIFVMLLTYPKFRDLTPKVICETTEFVDVLFGHRCGECEEVDDLVAKAIAAGGSS